MIFETAAKREMMMKPSLTAHRPHHRLIGQYFRVNAWKTKKKSVTPFGGLNDTSPERFWFNDAPKAWIGALQTFHRSISTSDRFFQELSETTIKKISQEVKIRSNIKQKRILRVIFPGPLSRIDGVTSIDSTYVRLCSLFPLNHANLLQLYQHCNQL